MNKNTFSNHKIH